MRKLEIEIPNDKEIDWAESAKQEKIVFKEKQLTYKDVCKKLFERPYAYYTDSNGVIHTFSPKQYPILLKSPINATSEHQLKCMLAKNKLANVARYLNGEWKPGKTKSGHFDAYVLYVTPNKDYIGYVKIHECAHNSNVLFKSRELAQQAIKILGEEEIKLALEPLY
jgi:hypothetical protein